MFHNDIVPRTGPVYMHARACDSISNKYDLDCGGLGIMLDKPIRTPLCRYVYYYYVQIAGHKSHFDNDDEGQRLI